MLSDSPPERDLEWTEAGVEGAWRFINRLWRLASEPPAALPAPGSAKPAQLSAEAEAAWRLVHKTIAQVSESVENLRFNVAVAQIRTLSNALEDLKGDRAPARPGSWREGLRALVKLIGPMMPHLAEEMWTELGRKGLLCDQAWPQADPELSR